MSTGKFPQTVKGNLQDLFFSYDPEARRLAAATLGRDHLGAGSKREVLEALNTALHDPVVTVQDAALQSLVRLART